MRYLCQADAEASEDLLHVASLLHGDDTQVILLVHPDQEGLVVIVPGGKQANSLSLQTQSIRKVSDVTDINKPTQGQNTARGRIWCDLTLFGFSCVLLY